MTKINLNDENCAILDYDTASSYNSLLRFWHNLYVPSSRVKNPFWVMQL